MLLLVNIKLHLMEQQFQIWKYAAVNVAANES